MSSIPMPPPGESKSPILPSDLSPEMFDLRSKIIAKLSTGEWPTNVITDQCKDVSIYVAPIRRMLTGREHKVYCEFVSQHSAEDIHQWLHAIMTVAGYEILLPNDIVNNYALDDGCQTYIVICECNKTRELLEVVKAWTKTLPKHIMKEVKETLLLVDVKEKPTEQSVPAFMFEIKGTDEQIDTVRELKAHATTDTRIKQVLLGNRKKQSKSPTTIVFNS